MKKLLLIFLVLMLALTACSPAETTNTDEPTGQPDEQTGGDTPVAVDGSITALRVGGIDITSNEYRYHYFSNMQTLIGYYGAYMGIDENTPLEDQYYDEGATWADYFREQAVNSIRNAVILSDQAKKAGMTLDDSFKQRILDDINDLKDYCDSEGVSVEQVLAGSYGGSLDEASLYEIIERVYLGYQFELSKRAGFDTGEAAIEEYYNAHASDFDSVDYISYMFDDSEAAQACLGASTDIDAFYAFIADNYEEDLDDYMMIGDNNMGDEPSDWLFDSGRAPGDMAIVEAYDVYIMMYFIDRYRPDDESLSIRHLLISSDNIGADAAHARAEELYNEWKKGAATEDTFAAMATSYTEDPGSMQTGGLYEDVYEGQMVDEFDSWCFDPARKPGDSGLVDTSFGTHIMYYTGYVEGWMNQVKQAIIESEYGEFYEALMPDYEVEEVDMNVAK